MPLRDRTQGGNAEREQQEVQCPGAGPALCVLDKIRAKIAVDRNRCQASKRKKRQRENAKLDQRELAGAGLIHCFVECIPLLSRLQFQTESAARNSAISSSASATRSP